MIKVLFCLWMLLLAGNYADATGRSGSGWFPLQKEPEKIVTCKISRFSDVREMNLAQSVSGLAALALNEGINNEGVWITAANPQYKIYYHSLIKRLGARESGVYDVWSLVSRYKRTGVIKGYILYDASRHDNSVNLATMLAALKKGVLIDITQQDIARKQGLSKLADVSDKSFDPAAFNELKTNLSRDLLVVANPKFSNNRDYAIAHKSIIYYGVDSLFTQILDWVHPLSPVIGWNAGDEFKQIEPCSSRGLINIPADWCTNLALLTIPPAAEQARIRSLDPERINWSEDKSYHAFVMSDGDNMQWTFGGFINSDDYWSNPWNAGIPVSFTSCIVNLHLAGADVLEQLVKGQPENVSVVEYGGGYYYPDLFGRYRAKSGELLREFAKRLNAELKKTGVKVFGFICKDVSSASALEAYKIYAEELEGITGMIAVQYSPYNGGDGKLFWVKNKDGIQIPVITAKYQLWADLKRKGSGNPKELAGFINSNNKAGGQLNWTIVHAWSYYRAPDEDVRKADRKNTVGGKRGVTPVKWTKDMIADATKIVSIEELIWRLRMRHNTEETKKAISDQQI